MCVVRLAILILAPEAVISDFLLLDDGYRLTYGGYDYLAMRALSKRDTMYSVGNQIGVGKESGMSSWTFLGFHLTAFPDIYIVANAEGKNMVLKLHRFAQIYGHLDNLLSKWQAWEGVISSYQGEERLSWMYMSRLSAQKEWAFMKVSEIFITIIAFIMASDGSS
jgi:RIO kinase 2